jgi:hypothetical protein
MIGIKRLRLTPAHSHIHRSHAGKVSLIQSPREPMVILDGGPDHAWCRDSVPFWGCFMAQLTHPSDNRWRVP